MRRWMVWTWLAAALVLLANGFYQGMYVAPREETMGDLQRIFYYHVPSAITAFLCFFVNLIASITYLARRRDPWVAMKADAVAVSGAEVGLLFCSVVLTTGPLWAKPAWGIWWAWDARLTLTLVLWLLYVSYLMLRRFSSGGQTATVAAVLAVFSFADVPINYMAIRWWRTQHPQPVIAGGPNSGLDPRMLHALGWNFLAFLVWGSLLLYVRYRLERREQEVEQQRALRALESTLEVLP